METSTTRAKREGVIVGAIGCVEAGIVVAIDGHVGEDHGTKEVARLMGRARL